MEQKTKTIIKDIYVANDGTEFNSEDSCINYEEKKEQENLEQRVETELGFKTQANFPAMLNSRYDHEYKLFLIKNEQDLDLFVKTYEYWFTRLDKYWQVSKEIFVYPDVLCILDFPTGGDEHRLYKMSQLIGQFEAFLSEINDIVLPVLKEIPLKPIFEFNCMQIDGETPGGCPVCPTCNEPAYEKDRCVFCGQKFKES